MEWVKLSNETPPLDTKVLCINQFFEMQVCSLEKRWRDSDATFWSSEYSIFYPTHWMDLPSVIPSPPSM